MKKRVLMIYILLLSLTSCEGYIEFEKARFKYIILPIFFGTLIIGLLGLIFRKKD